MTPFAERLADAVRTRGNAVCLGLDPRWESLPRAFRDRYAGGTLDEKAQAYEDFSIRILDLVGDQVPIVKPQAAFFEACGPAGVGALHRVMQVARERGLLTILDAKRNDIASTASAYAEAAFEVFDADALTINPYLGRDAVEPFVQTARRLARGLFVLVRTSNPGAGLFQDLVCDGKPLYRHVAEAVAAWNAENRSSNGLGDVGAVVGATHPRELAELREVMPDVWLLVPGYGAQGGSAAEVRAAFRADGLGAIINSSRGLTFPYTPDDPDWELKVREATGAMMESLR